MKTNPHNAKRPVLARALLSPCIALAISVLVNLTVHGDEPKPEKPQAETKADTKSETKPAEDTPDYSNWLELSVGSAFVTGDKAQFQRRHDLPAGPFGGVADFHVEQPFQKKGIMSIDGRGIFDDHDYSLKLEISHPDKGFVRGGYREFRTWYDGSGGFFPGGTNHWLELYNDELHIDRGEFWIEAGLTIPNVPEVIFHYSHEFRQGEKDSTEWGDTALLGLPGPNNSRGIVPTFLGIDEKRDIFALDAKHTISKTTLGLGVRYEATDNDDTRNIHRRPGELTGTATQAADRFVTQRDQFQSDMFNAHGSSETRFNDQVLLTTGYSYTKLDTDVGGSRIYGADYDPVYDPLFARRQQRDEGFLDLRGGSQVNQHVGNLNLMLTPWDSVTIVPSLRIERQDQNGDAAFTQTSFGAPPARATANEDLFNTRQWGYTDVSEALELRYTGVTNWVFYVRGEWLESQGDLKERQGDNDPDATNATPAAIILRDTDCDRFTQKYIAGINWYPLRRLNLAAQYYHKVRQNDYEHLVDSTTNAPPSANRYPAFLTDQDFETDDVNFRFTWRPWMNFTLIGRYDFQLSTVHTRGDFLDTVESGKTTTHILAGSLSWVPWNRLYVQANVNYVLDRTETPADDFVGSATNQIVLPARNNYWNASAMLGFALDEKTDLQAQYSYYRADNYVDNSAFSVPYGAGAEEHGVTASLSRQITKQLRWTLRYGFFNHHDQTSGGHNDFEAHIVSSSLHFRF
jgi:hypothetical protein